MLPESMKTNPNRYVMQQNEKINKEMDWYKLWEHRRNKSTAGYLGERYKVNDPFTNKAAFVCDKPT